MIDYGGLTAGLGAGLGAGLEAGLEAGLTAGFVNQNSSLPRDYCDCSGFFSQRP